jgi:hypothetical protein
VSVRHCRFAGLDGCPAPIQFSQLFGGNGHLLLQGRHFGYKLGD